MASVASIIGIFFFDCIASIILERNQNGAFTFSSRATRRYEAIAWMRAMIGVVEARDLPAWPSEEELWVALKSRLILCHVINNVVPGFVPKVVEGPCDSSAVSDGAALCIYQCFENVRNFLVAVEQMGLPIFEASDLEQGGKSSRVVNCILALKSFHEWKQTGRNGTWKFGGNLKPIASCKNFVRKNSEPFKNSLLRNISMNESSMNDQLLETENIEMVGNLSYPPPPGLPHRE